MKCVARNFKPRWIDELFANILVKFRYIARNGYI